MREALLHAIAAIAEDAGAAILGVYESDFAVRHKDDGSPLTRADEASEGVILPALAALTPDIPIVSEEQVAAGAGPKTIGRRYWLVDPLDGTKEFVKRNGEFCVSIGLVKDGRPSLGVLHGPVGGVTYAGEVGVGAWMRRGGETEKPIACRQPPVDGLDVVVSRSHNAPGATAEVLARVRVRGHVAQGSALKFAVLAQGRADLYVRAGPTCEWDTAGGHALLEAAGGRVMQLDHTPLEYGKKGFLNPPFLALGRIDPP